MTPLAGALFLVLGVVVLFCALLHLTVRGLGGWRTAGRAVRRQAALTGAAFAAPVRDRRRYRRRLRLLIRLLGRPEGLETAERAMMQAAAAVPGVIAYGALLDPAYVGVLVACGHPVPCPPEPWIVDDDQRLWWIERADVAPAPAGPPPLLVTLGADEEHVILLDLLADPVTVSVQGDPRLARTLLATVAAQLDARLPVGAVTVTRDIHDRHPGPEAAGAVSAAQQWAAATGAPAFAVCAEVPAELPPAGVRLVVAGGARGTARILVARAGGIVEPHGTPLRADTTALARAVAAVLHALPPYGIPAHPDGDLVEPVLTTRTITEQTITERAVTERAPADADLVEPGQADRPAGVSATGAP